jgi:hypothetical protein
MNNFGRDDLLVVRGRALLLQRRSDATPRVPTDNSQT